MSASKIKAMINCKERQIYVLGVLVIILLHIILVSLLAGLVISDSDEAVYLYGFMRIFDTTQTGFQVPGWSYVDLNVIKILYFPAFLFSKLGFSDITSMRLGSLIYITLTFTTLLRYMRLNSSQDQKGRSNWLVFFIFLIPSTYFFTSLATRDSILGFFLAFTVLNFLRLDRKIQLHTSIAYLISITLVFAIKPHYYLIILLSALLAATWKVIHKKAKKKFLILIATLSILPMFYFPGSLEHQVNSLKSWDEKLFSVSESPISESPISDTRTLNEISNAARENRFLEIFLKFTGIADRIEVKLANPLSRETATARSARANIGNLKEESPFAYIGKAIRVFLFPLPFLDNGSFLLNLFAVEIVFWLFLYFYFLKACLKSIRQRVAVSATCMFSCFILLGYVIMSVITEESMQVALRHRNVLAILILLNLATFHKSTKSSELV